MAEKNSDFKWTFQRLGGLDQAVLHGDEDLRRIRQIDPKLWVALSCPASGLQFDARTLSLLDTDRDGRIRIPEIIAAVEWVSHRLKNPGDIRKCLDSLRLDAIDESTEEGRRLVLTGRAILRNLGKPDAGELTQEDVGRAAAHASEQMFNGDGILPPLDRLDPDIRGYITDAMAVIGGVEDASGDPGINREISDAFVKSLSDWVDWHTSVSTAATPLDDNTAEAWELLCELKEKIDDYFLRCELVAYAPNSRDSLNIEDRQLMSAETGLLDGKALAELPLSRVGADRPLDMRSGVNPAWRGKVERFADVIKPALASSGTLTRTDWLSLQEQFEPYAKTLAQKPAPASSTATIPPTMTLDKLGEERITEILSGDLPERFGRLADEDADVPAAATDIAHVERLVLYHKHLYRLLINFVNFEEFYSLCTGAAFQSGKLFIDGRSCQLCMPAERVEQHSALAANSQLYLLYCECTRGRKPGEKEPEKKATIVAAVTAGDSDLLMQNRNGVYVDNKGDDWDATVIKIVSNPIGLWQAVWNPYKKFGTMITDQIGKFANEKQAGLMASAGQKLEQMTAASPPQAAAPRFDIGRNVGIFAAVGLAVGAIGTAIGSIIGALFRMSWWQFPLLFAGLFALVSGPSLLIAWLKLRQRTLGPLLEASGWAINGRVAVNYTVSRRLTSTAVLPANSRRSRNDPLAKIRRWQLIAFLGALALGFAGVMLWLHFRAPRTARLSQPLVSVPQPQQPDDSVWDQLTKAIRNEMERQTPAVPAPAPAASPPATQAPAAVPASTAATQPATASPPEQTAGNAPTAPPASANPAP